MTYSSDIKNNDDKVMTIAKKYLKKNTLLQVPHRRPKKIYKSMLHSDPFEKEENGKKHDFLTEEEEEKKKD